MLVSPDDIDDELGFLTDTVVKSIMRLLGYKVNCDFAFETILVALDDLDSFDFVIRMLYSFGTCLDREGE